MKYKIQYREQLEFKEIEIDELDISLKLIRVIRTQDNPDIYHAIYKYKELEEQMIRMRVPDKADVFDYIQRSCMDYHENKDQPFIALAWGIYEMRKMQTRSYQYNKR